MSRVQVLVDQLQLKAIEEEEKYNQTAVLPISAYYKLCGLAEYLRIPRNRLAGMLLTASLDEAIDTLPNEEREFGGPHDAVFGTAADYVRHLAARERSMQQMAEEHYAKEDAKKVSK
jgi:hypothetical protein